MTALACALGAGGPRLAAAEAQEVAKHPVQPGDTLWQLAIAYGCEVEALRQANGLEDNEIAAGRELVIPACGGGEAEEVEVEAAVEAGAVEEEKESGKETGLVEHEVASGESLWTIAQRYRTTVADIQLRNGLAGHTIYAGKRLVIAPDSGTSGKVFLGQSVGRPHRGRLKHGILLPGGQGYYRRRPDYAWGTNYVVFHVRRAVTAVRRKFPGIHRLAIGDLSARQGGPIPRHNSHQSGRDVDFGLYYRKKPSRYPEEFVVATPGNLHFAATWRLVEILAKTADIDGGVERMFLGYRTQRLLYRWAREHGVSRSKLDELFQFPHGKGSLRGLIRHEPYHDDHLHVRFKCPGEDPSCD